MNQDSHKSAVDYIDRLYSAFTPAFPELSERQFKCLFYYSMGWSGEKIGGLIGCSGKTVRNKLQLMKDKFLLDSASDLRVIFLARLLTYKEGSND